MPLTNPFDARVRSVTRFATWKVFGIPLIIRDKRILLLNAGGNRAVISQPNRLMSWPKRPPHHDASQPGRIKALPSISVRLADATLGDFYRRYPGEEVGLTTVWENLPTYRLDQYDFAIQFGPTDLTVENVSSCMKNV